MANPDDLKIELTDLFGGDISEAKQAAERQEQLRAGVDANASAEEQRLFAEQEAERERRYQDMIRQRDEQLAQEAQDFEQKFQTPSESLDAVSAPPPMEATVSVEPQIPEAALVEEVPAQTFASETVPPETEAVVGMPPAEAVPEAPAVETADAIVPEVAAEIPLEVIAAPPVEIPVEAPPVPEPVAVPEPEPVPAPSVAQAAPASPDLINFDMPLMKPFGMGSVSPPPPPPPLPPSEKVAEVVPPIPPPADAEASATVPTLSVEETVITPGKVEPPGPSPEELARIKREHDFLALYDQFRIIVLHELTDLVGERKAKTMLTRTVETARNKNPEIFRNANWDAEGNLLEDGSVDEQRILQNKAALNPQDADTLQDIALGALYELRMAAVEKGLGAGLRSKIQTRYRQWLVEHREKAKADGLDVRSFDRLLAVAV